MYLPGMSWVKPPPRKREKKNKWAKVEPWHDMKFMSFLEEFPPILQGTPIGDIVTGVSLFFRIHRKTSAPLSFPTIVASRQALRPVDHMHKKHGKIKDTRWFKDLCIPALVGGHQQPLKGSRELTIPKKGTFAELPGNHVFSFRRLEKKGREDKCHLKKWLVKLILVNHTPWNWHIYLDLPYN